MVRFEKTKGARCFYILRVGCGFGEFSCGLGVLVEGDGWVVRCCCCAGSLGVLLSLGCG